MDQENKKQIRNFSIIAHIDHGKSTLADRFLELTGTISASKMQVQFLDRMDLEREKGITIKLSPVRMETKINGVDYILNLVDTPGHVDFTYEVSRSLAAVEGAILLVDATQGIQAQTLANLDLAKKQNLKIIPVVNKIDAAGAETEKTIEEMALLLETSPDRILKISAKTGEGVKELLETIVREVPAPKIEIKGEPFRALIFDSEYDSYKGVVAYVRVVSGEIKPGEKIKLIAADQVAEAKEIGYFRPGFSVQQKLFAGEIGYIATGVKEPGKVRAGDTITTYSPANFSETFALPGYQEPKPMVFASFYPQNPDDFDLLKDALSKLKLSDPSLVFEPETKEALGRGFRCGFLGTLHIEIISERIKREFKIDLIISNPSVVYKIVDQKAVEKNIYSATDWPNASLIKEMKEPWVFLEIITPVSYIGAVLEILKSLSGNYLDTKYLSRERVVLTFEIPLREMITSLYDKIKSGTQGYASLNYKILDFRPADLVKLEILVAEEKKEALSKIVPRAKAEQEGRKMVEKLKQVLPPEQFSVALQAAVGGKVIARETLKAWRKDVTGYLYGGDITRKRKLLEKQKKGKKLMKETGRVRISSKAFLEVFKS